MQINGTISWLLYKGFIIGYWNKEEEKSKKGRMGGLHCKNKKFS